MEKIRSDWWKEKDSNTVHEKLTSYVDALEKAQYWRTRDALIHARLYGNAEMMGLLVGEYTRRTEVKEKDRIRLNVIRNMINTLTSKISKNQPKPQFLTSSGNYKFQKKAERLTDFIETLFLKTEIYRVMPVCFRDSMIFKKGFAYIYREDDQIKVERVLPTEIIIDDIEAVNGRPRQIHRRKLISREVLISWVNAEHEKSNEIINIIENAHARSIKDKAGLTVENMINVTFSWHLPSSKDSVDGKYAITVDGGTITYEDYTKEYFPFVEIPWDDPLIGYWGQGLVEELKSIQFEINLILRRIQEAMYFYGHPICFVPPASVLRTDITNDMMNLIEYNGNVPPTIHTPVVMNAETYAHLDRLIQQAYQVSGVSQLSASSQKPPGLVSGIALQEYNDLETERFMQVAQVYENAYMKAARQYIEIAKEIAEDNGGSYPVTIKRGSNLESIDWKDIQLDEQDYMMQVWPVSLFSGSPSAKLQKIETLVNLGILDNKEEIARLLDFPDLKSFTSDLRAKAEVYDIMIEKTLEGKPLSPPDPILDIKTGLRKMSNAYNKAKLNGASDDVLTQFRNWITNANKISLQPQAPVSSTVGIAQPPQGVVPQSGAPPTILPQVGVNPEIM